MHDNAYKHGTLDTNGIFNINYVLDTNLTKQHAMLNVLDINKNNHFKQDTN